MKYIKPNIQKMDAYIPGEQPADLQRTIKLNTNENPYPPSPMVAKALADFDVADLRVYPDPAGHKFCEAVAEVFNVPADWVQIGNGSDDLLVMIARACGGPVVIPVPTFPYYETQAEIEDVELVKIPYGPDYTLPIEELIAANGAVTFVANPGSPTGTAITLEQVEQLAAGLDGLLVIDEAYGDFAGFTAAGLVEKYPNLLVLRTLSKGYSLAGLRLGFAIAQRCVLEQLWKTKEIYNVGVLVLVLATAAIQDQAWKNNNVAKIVKLRDLLANELKKLNWRVYSSETNFLFASPGDGQAESEYENLKEKGIFVRYFKETQMLRITIGTDEQNEALLAALR